jgi:hypothetical protein
LTACFFDGRDLSACVAVEGVLAACFITDRGLSSCGAADAGGCFS